MSPRSYDNQPPTPEQQAILQSFFERLDSLDPSVRQEAEDFIKDCWKIDHDGPITPQDVLTVQKDFEKKFGNLENNYHRVFAWFERENNKRPDNFKLTHEQLQLMSAYRAESLRQRVEFFNFVQFASGYISTTGLEETEYSEGARVHINLESRMTQFFDEPIPQVKPEHNPNNWKRGIDRYPASKNEKADQIIARKVPFLGKANILDVGRGEGYFLEQVKRKFGKKVKTHGVGVIDFGTSSDVAIEDDQVRPAEMLPWEWTGKMDVVFSNVAFEYFLFPEQALREVIRVMKKKGGEAYLDVDHVSDIALMFPYDEMLSFLGISDEQFLTIIKANFSAFANKDTILELVEQIAREQGVRIRVGFDNYEKGNQHIQLYTE